MAEVYSELLSRPCDSYSEEWRHECECRWLLKEKPDPIQLNLYLYGVENRDQVVTKDAAGKDRLVADHARLWKDPKTKPLSAYRGLHQTDQIREDVLKLKAMEKSR
jgi:hypothetical protein